MNPKRAIDAEWTRWKAHSGKCYPKNTHNKNRCASIFNPYKFYIFMILWHWNKAFYSLSLTHEWNEWVEKTVKVDLNIEVKCAEERQQIKWNNGMKTSKQTEQGNDKTPRREWWEQIELKLMGVIWCCERALQMQNQVQKMCLCANLMCVIFVLKF